MELWLFPFKDWMYSVVDSPIAVENNCKSSWYEETTRAAMFPMVSQFYDESLNGVDGFYGYRLNLAILRLTVHIIALLSAEIHF